MIARDKHVAEWIRLADKLAQMSCSKGGEIMKGYL